LQAANRAWVEALFAQWLEDPTSVHPSWHELFRDLEKGAATTREQLLGPDPDRRSIFAAGSAAHDGPPTPIHVDAEHTRKNAAVLQFISAYRRTGHLVARLDPLGLRQRERPRQLHLAYWGLGEEDLDTTFHTGRLAGKRYDTLRSIIDRCEAMYCGPLGAEFMYVREEERRRWVERSIEDAGGRIEMDRPTALRVLEKLTAAEGFETFIHTKFLGAKRFSIEGGEALIPFLDQLLTHLAKNGAQEVDIGMAHRGRLNVLANILGKAHGDIFEEFVDDFEQPEYLGSGDVKYHLGYTSNVPTADGDPLHVTLAFNPSHLEFVNPVVVGKVRGRQDHFGDADHRRAVPVLLHGDAAFIGQGVVAETLNLSRLPGYTTGGTIHVVVNNQIGFTTPPSSSRSSEHCTDMVKVVLPPVFHVNCDDLDAVAFVAKLAAEYRQRFREDVVIDLWCYRKYGHNETDEPAFTNPIMVKAVRARKTPLETFVARATSQGLITTADVEQATTDFKDHLERELNRARSTPRERGALGGLWKGMYRGQHPDARIFSTAVDADTLKRLATALTRVPTGLVVHRKIQRVLDYRAKAAEGQEPINWSMGELLAFATLLNEGHHVRMSGQDSGRGTFSHRHAVLHDQTTGQQYQSLNHLGGQAQGQCVLFDSPLSEAAVLGFEFGYSLAAPDALVVWEAQFGDFANGAQVIIDQFLSSSEDKWDRCSGIVLLLPHGYEGMGPEHSSARLGRFLQLSGEENWRVVNLTTPAQIFHALRSQLKRNFRKPLVVMSPKSLLRHPRAVSQLSDLSEGGFQRVIDDVDVSPEAVRRVVLCSGKVYYDLLEARQGGEVALVRVEQLYPFPTKELEAVLGRYASSSETVWCQEEPANMGGWSFVFEQMHMQLERTVRYVGRPRAAAPATGSKHVHQREQQALVREALELEEEEASHAR
jgi:2-oxoglutarate dehydrogenase E1 component